MPPIKFTVGMAVFDAHPRPGVPHVFFESVRAKFTAMSALTHHPLVGEVIVVDNNPHPDNPLRHLAPKSGGQIRYVEMSQPQGTAPPRNRVFAEARFDHVVVMDPHVLLYPGTFEALAEFYAGHGVDCPDVLHGCMMTETRGHMMCTHMNDIWREQMLGTWGVAWIMGDPKHKFNSANQCILCGRTVGNQIHAGEYCPKAEYTLFSTHTHDDKTLVYLTMPDDPTEQRVLSLNEVLEIGLPTNVPWPGHELKLVEAGCTVPSEPFPIPGHGMGFFACRKDAWLPFHPDCRGFGGEEITTGKRFRQAGRLAWCVPGVKWWHDFERPGGQVPYNLSNWNKIRNYLLEFNRLGLNILPVKQHFWGKVPHGEWAQLESGVEWPDQPAPDVDPANFAASQKESLDRALAATGNVPANVEAIRRGHESVEDKMLRASSESNNSRCGQPTTGMEVIDQLYAQTAYSPSPVQAEMPRLRALAAVCGHGGGRADVVEISHQAVTAAAFLAAAPKSLTSYAQPAGGRTTTYQKIAPAGCEYRAVNAVPDGEPIPECDLLFLDVDPHTEEYYYMLLTKHAPRSRRLIAVHDSVAYGEAWNNLPGVMPAVRRFLQLAGGAWHEAIHWTDQNGLLVLSRDAGDSELLKKQVADYYAKNAGKMFPQTGQNPPPAGGDPPQKTFPPDGVGARLKEILASVGVNPSAACDCNYRALQMNEFGPDGCEERIDEIVGWLKDGSDRWSWTEKVMVAAKAVTSGLAFKLDVADPYKSFVRHAIKLERERLAKLEKTDGAGK